MALDRQLSEIETRISELWVGSEQRDMNLLELCRDLFEVCKELKKEIDKLKKKGGR